MGSRLERINDWEARARVAKYRVANLARNVNVTSRQLERYFLRAFDCHPRDWIKDLRRRDALHLKRRGLLNKEIAERLNFKQASHFSRLFGRHRSPRAKASRRRRLDK
jgi:transcriptional regulator GlxA family with amidase domain